MFEVKWILNFWLKVLWKFRFPNNFCNNSTTKLVNVHSYIRLDRQGIWKSSVNDDSFAIILGLQLKTKPSIALRQWLKK